MRSFDVNEVGHQTTTQYSKIGLTNEQYNAFKHRGSVMRIEKRFIIPIVLRALLTVTS